MLSRRSKKLSKSSDAGILSSTDHSFPVISFGSAQQNKTIRTKGSRKLCYYGTILMLVLFIAGFFITLSTRTVGVKNETKRRQINVGGIIEEEQQKQFSICSFRSYPPNRFYNLGTPYKDQPSFLSTEALYIRGKLPVILDDWLQEKIRPQKVCIDTSEWELEEKEKWPFVDGQNPSLVSLASHPYPTISGSNPRLDPKHISSLLAIFSAKPEDLVLVASVFGNGQCNWKMSSEDVLKYRFSDKKEAPTQRTVIAVMHAKTLYILGQSTLLLEQDASWGRRSKVPPKKNNDGTLVRSVQQFDDARFFFHDGYIWVLYRNGPMFGYNDQVQNRLYFEELGTGFVAYLKASETITVCCGRNMPFLSETSTNTKSLKALTWVDPVTVIDVDVSKLYTGNAETAGSKATSRRLADAIEEEHLNERTKVNFESTVSIPLQVETSTKRVLKFPRRNLANENKKKSNIHGTNGFLIYLEKTSEWLGIAHFHRPDKRDTSEYALHGHHYSHAFFTIISNQDGKFALNRLSNEFVFRTMSSPRMDDADIIQFAAGLDLVGSDTLILSYGINDCEGAVFYLEMQEVQKLLQSVSPGQEVADLMEKV
mmetsp:Transcript_6257/g.9161  ORF Transcript_6257/g.9161 Transcript_6257/m.9161 type:complete len:596 (-) Transcript_6257:154-1941(-)|eukprot:CAMPEP_0172427088 /NCGR_PEP_ID=MMETSP1064-20121228/40475_1 /TAXON_ID=202472 /ORGANISM="Aulacoseira subarctica , Strain CCAP 1002/5" /LENGTH=595 /DNA_ID=CAMNT_0013171079 /DNA_START=57 /DNA_END=1844 /DNA_ORIENTATION=+